MGSNPTATAGARRAPVRGRAPFLRPGARSPPHLRRLRHELSARRELVRAVVVAAGHQPVGDAAGAHLVVPLASRAQEERGLVAARASGVVVSGLAESCLESARAGVVVGWAAPGRDELGPALRVVGDVLPDLHG